MAESVLKTKSYQFALEIIVVAKNLNEQREFILSKQILRSGTAIGALIREAEFAQSRKDFISKLSIALKEANETEYWLSLLADSNYLEKEPHTKLSNEVLELIKLLVSSIRTSKSKL
ncbi:MAG: four helix bundle protein [Salinivirgaceae bacterium]